VTLLEEVMALLPKFGGADGLKIRSERGPGPLGWDPITPEEETSAECVTLRGVDCFAAVCRIGGMVRYIAGLNSDQPDSRSWPEGEEETLERALSMVVGTARRPYETPDGK
jgi:hypothetical protein